MLFKLLMHPYDNRERINLKTYTVGLLKWLAQILLDLSSAVQIYVSHIYIHLFILHGYITNSQYDQLPVGLIAQLVEHCTGIAEVMGSNPVQAYIFFRLSFRNCLSCVVTARIFLLFDLSSTVQIYVSYIYIQPEIC